MALPKQVKVGGSYYKGTSLSVDSASGDYVIFIVATGTGGAVIATLAESIPNMGAGIPINLDFFAMERMGSGEALKVTYTNTASIAMTLFIVSERGR